ncbi:MAG: DNA recombination protein RmuC, partial [Spirochaetota bacterium]
LKQQIALVEPTTLLMTLKVVERIWRFERQIESVEAVYTQAEKIYDKFCGFLENFEKIGKQLDTVSSTFKNAQTQISGKGGLTTLTERLKGMGAKPKKEIPRYLLPEK